MPKRQAPRRQLQKAVKVQTRHTQKRHVARRSRSTGTSK